MQVIECVIKRSVFADGYTLGEFSINGEHFAYTCEDKDRIDDGEAKIQGESAIPCGRYPLTVSLSNRFGRIMPEVKDVPGFKGIRIHGGNTAADTEGCPLIGEVQTLTGVQRCKDVVAKLITLIMAEEKKGNVFYLTVK